MNRQIASALAVRMWWSFGMFKQPLKVGPEPWSDVRMALPMPPTAALEKATFPVKVK
jgi:hypothetical protein